MFFKSMASAVFICLVVVSFSATAVSFRGLNYLEEGGNYSRAYGISSDGRIIVGDTVNPIADSSPNYSVRWISVSNSHSLQPLTGPGSTAYATSENGTIVIGNNADGTTGTAFRWSEDAGMVSLGVLSGQTSSTGLDVSADGSVIVGRSGSEAFRWTESTGMVGLGVISGLDSSFGQGVSADGSVVVGFSQLEGTTHIEAFRWASETGMVGLGDLSGGDFYSRADSISSDGNVIVGHSITGSGREAFRWTEKTGMVGLGNLPNGFQTLASATSANGSIVVGGNYKSGGDAFIWDEAHGMRGLTDVLTKSGVDLSGWKLIAATSISDDGSLIVGWGVNPDGNQQAWLADITLAAVISVDWQTPGDNLITQDANTNLEWLDITVTQNRSYNDISSKLGSGQEFDGWRYASPTEVRGFFNAFGGDSLHYNGWSTQNNGLFDKVSRYWGDYGCVVDCSTGDGHSHFMTPAGLPDFVNQGLIYDSVNDSESLLKDYVSTGSPNWEVDRVGGVGSALVRVITRPAVEKSWACHDASWIDVICWSPIGLPLNLDDVLLAQTDAVDRVVTYSNTISPVLNLNSLTIDATGSGTMTLSQSQDSLASDTETIGNDGTGVHTQTGGNNIVNDLYLGYMVTGDGTYHLGGTGNLLADREIISWDGNGTFNQTGGNNEARRIIIAGGNDFSYRATGTYHLSDGNLLTGSMEVARYGANGVFNQTGGSVVIDEDLIIATQYGARGVYNLSGGTLDVRQGLGFVYFAYDDESGVFNQTGGSVTANSVDGAPNGGFTYNLDGGMLTTESINFFASSFNHNGGDNTVTDAIKLVVNEIGNRGVYSLSDGKLNVSNIVIKGSTFTQTGGSNTVSSDLSIATVINSDQDESGEYTLTGGKLDVANITVETDSAFNFNGGTLAVDKFTGNLVNNGGVLSPGSSPGKTQINGSFTQSDDGVYEVEIGGHTQGSKYDWLNITGNASLSGTLIVNLIDLGSGLFIPREGDVFDILSAESITGEFDKLTLPVLGGSLKWDINYLANFSGTTDIVRLTVTKDNVIPTANAGIDQFVNETTPVNLNANLSSDIDGTIVSYSWTQTAGIAITLNGANTSTPSFVAPVVISDNIQTFSLVVTDNNGSISAADTVRVTVRNVNVLPTENAGVDQTVNESDTVNLNGNRSSDGDGTVVSYRWTQIAGTTVVLSGANTRTPSFMAPAVTSDATLTFSLVVTDNNGGSSSANSINITVSNVNVLPTADAGVDQLVHENDAVQLNGNLSFDSDGSISSHSWIQTAGKAVVLSGARTATSTFVAPVGSNNTTLSFSLVVTDNDGGVSVADSIDVMVTNDNIPPVANAGFDQVVNESEVVDLDGQASSDSDGVISDYRWVQTAGTTVAISGANTATPSFSAPSVISDSMLIFTLKVTDNKSDIGTTSITIKVINTLVVDAGSDQQITEGDTVRLNGLNSLGVKSDIESYQWIQTEGPTVNLIGSDSATPTFIAPSVSLTKLLVFNLFVFDNNGSMDTDTVFVNVRDELLTGIASPLDVQLIDSVAVSNELYQLDTQSDPFFASTNLQWVQIDGPAVTLDDADQAIPSFTVPVVDVDSTATFEVRSENIDGLIIRARASINILGSNSGNQTPFANAGTEQIVTEGNTVLLDATASIDDENIVDYYWQQTGGPMVMLTSIIQAQTSFVAPAIAAVDDGTELTFELVVIDDGGFVDRQSVIVTVLDNGITAFTDDVIAIISSSGDPIGIQSITGGSLVTFEAVDPDTIADDVNRPDFLPYGLIDFGVRVELGATVEVSVSLPSPADTNLTWWKYVNGSGWIDYSANTSFNAARDIVTITLTDNGVGDDDPALGMIRDPGGLAIAAPVSVDGGNPPANGGGASSSSGGSMGSLMLIYLLLGFIARTYAKTRQHSMGQVFITRD